jgi:hypothetical protein
MWHNAFFSPFVIPVAGMALALGIILIGAVSNYHKQKLLSEERLTALAKGLTLPPIEESEEIARPANPRRRLHNTRQGGIVTIATGIGLVLFSIVLMWVTEERATLIVGGAGLIPLCIGVGMLIDYGFQLRDLRESGAPDA